MDNGMVGEYGPPQELLKNPNSLFSQLIGIICVYLHVYLCIYICICICIYIDIHIWTSTGIIEKSK
jgi:hypothetical protein